MPEAELIEGLKQKQEPAFRELVTSFQHRVYNTALSLVQNEGDAEDLAQEVFIKVFHNIGQFKGEAQLSTWIYKITVTQALDFLRKKKRQKRGGLLVSMFNKPADEWDTPDFSHPGVKTENKEDSAILFKAIRQLPENQQTAFVLQKLEGLKQDEIAKVLETTVSSVESLLHRAKQNLRKLLADHYQQ